MKTRATMFNRSSRKFEKAVKQWSSHETALVEGDSWFQYDFMLGMGGSNLYKEVVMRRPMVTLALSQNGDTALNMLSDDGLEYIEEKLSMHRFNYLFFSGGGNDIVNNLGELGNQQKLLDEIRSRLELLCDLRDQVSPSTRIITHNYGYPNLEKDGFKRFGGLVSIGPWIKPKFFAQGVRDIWVMDRIIRGLMDRFSLMLSSLEGRILVADTCSVVKKEDWSDEMHLTPEGYKKAAEAFFR